MVPPRAAPKPGRLRRKNREMTTALVTAPAELFTTTEYAAACVGCTWST